MLLDVIQNLKRGALLLVAAFWLLQPVAMALFDNSTTQQLPKEHRLQSMSRQAPLVHGMDKLASDSKVAGELYGRQLAQCPSLKPLITKARLHAHEYYDVLAATEELSPAHANSLKRIWDNSFMAASRQKPAAPCDAQIEAQYESSLQRTYGRYVPGQSLRLIKEQYQLYREQMLHDTHSP